MHKPMQWSAAAGLIALLLYSQSLGQGPAAENLEPGYFFDPQVQPVELLQPAAEPSEPARQPVRRARSQQANIRLASVPNMFGDFAMLVGDAKLQFVDPNG